MDRTEVTLLEIIRGYTGDNRIKDHQIRNLIVIQDPDERKPGHGLRRIVNSLRQNGHPICSDTRGYWYATTPEELSEFIESLRGRATKILEAVGGLSETLKEWEQQKPKTTQGTLV